MIVRLLDAEENWRDQSTVEKVRPSVAGCIEYFTAIKGASSSLRTQGSMLLEVLLMQGLRRIM